MWKLLLLLCLVFNTCNAVIFRNFSTKTLYEWTHDIHTPVPKDSASSDSASNCTAIQVNMVSRHGARYPTLSNMKEIIKLHKKIVDFKNQTTFPELNNWTFPYNMSLEGQLVEKGYEELNKLGARTAQRFDSFIRKNIQNIKFISTSKSRVKDSSESFYKGLGSVLLNLLPSYKSEINDTILRFFDGCQKYETLVRDNWTNMIQFYDYQKTPAFLKVADSVKTRLGLQNSLSPSDIYQLYDLCSYETYISQDSRWCDLLTDAEKSVLEYGQDIQAYYKLSYGNSFNGEMACPLVSDLFKSMDETIQYLSSVNSTQNYDAVRFLFGHGETILPLFTALGLFKDSQPLLSTNRDDMVNRKFRTSSICTFASNIAIVMYSCDSMPALNSTYIKVFVNEMEVVLPECSSNGCQYKHVRAAYQRLIDSCNITKLCSLDVSAARRALGIMSLHVLSVLMTMAL